MSAFGLTAAGEFSNAINDCGLYVNGVGLGTRYEGTYPGYTTAVGSCTSWEDYSTWDQSLKDSTKQFALSSMDALQVSLFPSHTPNIVLIVLRRTGFSGHGKLETRQVAPSKHPPGHINWVWTMDGCLQTPVRRTVPVETQIHGSRRWLLRKQVAPALAKLPPALLRRSHGHPLLSQMGVLSHSSHSIPIRVTFRRFLSRRRSPMRLNQRMLEMAGTIPPILYHSRLPLLRAHTLIHG
jgi:hypothetical protein